MTSERAKLVGGEPYRLNHEDGGLWAIRTPMTGREVSTTTAMKRCHNPSDLNRQIEAAILAIPLFKG